jgi:MerR family mercuric resistance operon transcriptional regulator
MAPTTAKDAPRLGIGALSERTGCNIETIRYYERIGLLPAPPRTAGGHRHYGEHHLKHLSFVRRARDLGFPLETVRTLLSLADPGAAGCQDVERLASGHLDDVKTKIADLKRLEKVLADLVKRCRGGTVPECPIIETLFTIPDAATGAKRPRGRRAA